MKNKKKEILLSRLSRKKKKKKKVLKARFSILALDLGLSMGWAVEGESGVWKFKEKRGESVGMRWIRFRAKLKEMIKLCKINVVAFERPAGRHVMSVVNLAKFAAIIEEECTLANLDFVQYSAKELKVRATGKGNSGKEKMVLAAKEELHYEGESDDEADALWILVLCKEEIN